MFVTLILRQPTIRVASLSLNFLIWEMRVMVPFQCILQVRWWMHVWFVNNSASNYTVSHMSWSTLVFRAHHDLSKKGYSFIYQIFIKHSLWPGHYSAGWGDMNKKKLWKHYLMEAVSSLYLEVIHLVCSRDFPLFLLPLFFKMMMKNKS